MHTMSDDASSEEATWDLVSAYRRMAQFRWFEEGVGLAVREGVAHGEMHLAIGQEAIAVGLEPWLRRGDAVVSTHRPHLHALMSGVDPVVLLAELFGRTPGLSGGKGGHMHLFDPSHDFMCTGIVGASVPLALGYALARKGKPAAPIAVAVLGDGGANHGTFSECLNMAALWSLPVLFLIEDNGYAISVGRATSTAGDVAERGKAYGVAGWKCDGTRVDDVYAAAGAAVACVRAGAPALLVATATRFRGHYEGDLDLYRNDREKSEIRAGSDPLTLLRARLLEKGTTTEEIDAVELAVADEVSSWIRAARAMPEPHPDAALRGVFV